MSAKIFQLIAFDLSCPAFLREAFLLFLCWVVKVRARGPLLVEAFRAFEEAAAFRGVGYAVLEIEETEADFPFPHRSNPVHRLRVYPSATTGSAAALSAPGCRGVVGFNRSSVVHPKNLAI